MIKFVQKSSRCAQRQLGENIGEEIKSLLEEVENIEDRSKKDCSIFDICELGMELTSILTQMNSSMMFQTHVNENIAKPPNQGMNQAQQESFNNLNKQINDIKDMCKGMVDKEKDYEQKLKDLKDKYEEQLRESRQKI